MVWQALVKTENKVLRRIKRLIIVKKKITFISCFAVAIAITGAALWREGNTDKGLLTGALMLFQLAGVHSDLKLKIIPVWLMPASLLLGAVIIHTTAGAEGFKNHIIGAVMAFFVLALMIFISKGQIGGGDLQLFVTTGFFTGSYAIVGVILLSTVLSGLYSLLLLFFKKVGRDTEFAFAPFALYATAFVSLGSTEF